MADAFPPADRPSDDEGWVTSSFSSGSGECVEVRHAGDAVAVRDSKNRAGGALAFGASAWARFVASGC